MKGTIVHVVEDLGLGGMERALKSWLVIARDRGLDVLVLCARGEGPVAEELRRGGFRVDLVAGGVVALSRAVHRVPRQPVLVHTHGAARAVGRVAGRLGGAGAVLHHLHGTEAFGLKQRLFERLLRADVYLACSKFVAEDFRRQTGFSAEVVYNPVDAGRFAFSEDARRACRAELGISDGAPVVLTVGRVVSDKGQWTLVDAAPAVLARRTDAVFLFVGDGPARAENEKRAAALGASVRFLGVREDVIPYLCASDVYVQPSLNREGLGIAALEAMACERPVVATKVQGLVEAVAGVGLLVVPGDAAALSAAVLELLAAPDSRRERGAAGRRRVVETFSPSAAERRLLEIYDRFLSRARP